MTFTMRPDWFVEVQTHDISDLDGWLDFVAKRDVYQPPPLLTRPEYAALSPATQGMYDVARRIGNNNLPKHETPMTIRARQQIQAVLLSNLYRMDPGVRSGIFISADGAMGKSTLMRDIAANYVADLAQFDEVFPNSTKFRDRSVPVMWVTVPPKLSIGSLGRAILHFYGEHIPSRANDSAITARVEEVIRDCGTRLAVLDDITRYKDGEADRYAADWVRNLMETSVSIIAMGVDIRGSGILHEGTSRARNEKLSTQTARRFTVLDIDTFRYDTTDNIRAWVGHLMAVEDDLLLLDKEPGMLSEDLAEFLFDQTGGVIGTLTDYIQLAATSVIGRHEDQGGEYLTREDFEVIPVKGSGITAAPDLTPAKTRAATRNGRRKGRNSMYDQPANGAA